MSTGAKWAVGLALVFAVVALAGTVVSLRWQSRTRAWLQTDLIPRAVFDNPTGPPDPYAPPPPPPPF